MSALVSKLFLGQQITQSYLEEWARSAGTPLLGNYFVASISNEDMHSSIIEFLSTRMGHLHSCCAYAEMRKCNYILFTASRISATWTISKCGCWTSSTAISCT